MTTDRSSRGAGLATLLLTLVGWASVPLFLRHFASQMDAWTSNGWRYGFAALLWFPVAVATLRSRRTGSATFRAAIVPGIANSIGQVFFTWAHYRIDPGLLTFGLRTQILFVAAGAYLLFPAERRAIRSIWFWAGVALVLAGTAGTVFGGVHPPRSAELQGIAMAILAGFFFAGYGLGVRHYMAGFRSIPSFAVISLYTAAAMVALMLAFGDRLGAAPLDLPRLQLALLLLSSVIGIALGHVLYYVSIARIGVAVSAGVLQLQPFCVAAASLALFGETLTLLQWIGGGVAVAGAVAMLVAQQRASIAAAAATG